jgi:hypothetical protein
MYVKSIHLGTYTDQILDINAENMEREVQNVSGFVLDVFYQWTLLLQLSDIKFLPLSL